MEVNKSGYNQWLNEAKTDMVDSLKEMDTSVQDDQMTLLLSQLERLSQNFE
jgi:hypothetical protein